MNDSKLNCLVKELDSQALVDTRKRNIENDYDSDEEVVRKAKTKATRELRMGIEDYLNGIIPADEEDSSSH